MRSRLKFLLLQIRKPDDPMLQQEVRAFSEAIRCDASQLTVCDLITDPPSSARCAQFDMVLIGGSGDFSVASGGEWLPAALECMAELVERAQPTFASCWGFQAMARALGGEVVTDLGRAELGTPELMLTESGIADPVFGILPKTFRAPMGHQDIVDRLPRGAELLVYSRRVRHEAFGFPGKPIYATQFHPELTRQGLMERLRTYPEYIEKIVGIPEAEFEETCVETPDSHRLMQRMIDVVFDS